MFFRDKEMEESFQVVRNSCYKAPKMRCLLWAANAFRVQIKGSLIQAHSLLHGHFLGTPPCYADNWSSPSVRTDTLTLLAGSKTWPWKCILRGKQRGRELKACQEQAKPKTCQKHREGSVQLCIIPLGTTWFQRFVSLTADSWQLNITVCIKNMALKVHSKKETGRELKACQEQENQKHVRNTERVLC